MLGRGQFHQRKGRRRHNHRHSLGQGHRQGRLRPNHSRSQPRGDPTRSHARHRGRQRRAFKLVSFVGKIQNCNEMSGGRQTCISSWAPYWSNFKVIECLITDKFAVRLVIKIILPKWSKLRWYLRILGGYYSFHFALAEIDMPWSLYY